MKLSIFKASTLLLFALCSSSLWAQEGAQELEERHSLSILIGHTHLDAGILDGESRWLSVPAFGFGYSYKLNHKWGIGLQSDLVITNFEVETFEGDGGVEGEISRNFPWSMVPVVQYKPMHWLSIAVGSGIEFEESENLFLVKVGAEANYPINEKLELIAELSYDYKPEYYNSWGIFLGVARTF